MIQIYTSDWCRPEKEYVCSVLIGDILGAEYQITFRDGPEWEFILPKGTIRFPDLFQYPWKPEHIPSSVARLNIPLMPEKDLPALYCKGNYSQKGEEVYIPVDIFASSFFMLSRWEELIVSNTIGRFSAKDALAFREGFLNRPVVNEYACVLGNYMEKAGWVWPTVSSGWNLVPTHDIDMIRFAKPKRFAGDLIKHRSLSRFFYRMRHIKENPWDCVDWLMDLSGQAGTVSRFYVLPGGTAPMDHDFSLRDPLAQKIIKRIIERNHILGIHPSYSAADNISQLQREKKRLEKAAGISVKEGREHYLRWLPGITPLNLEKEGIAVDSSLGYFDQPGYRCGTGSEFSLYDLKTRRPMTLRERPLTFMDGTVRDYLKGSPEMAWDYLKALKDQAIKYNMPQTILFHNSSFDKLGWPGWKEMYADFLTNQ